MLFRRLWHKATLLAVAAAFTPTVGAADPGDPAAARSPVYQWTAEDGGIRYTPDPSRIPANRRHTERRIDPGPARVEAPPSPPQPEGRGGPIDAPQLSKPTAGPPAPPSTTTSARPDSTSGASFAPSPRQDRWAVQLLATPMEHERPSLPAVELRAGERLYRTTARVDGALWSRLRVGLFPTRAAAQEALERLAPEFPGAWVIRLGSAEELLPVTAVAAKDAPPGPTESDTLAPRPGSAGTASEVDASPRYAIQLCAIPASEDPGPLPALTPPPGSQLYWTSVDWDDQSWRRLRLGDFTTLAAARAALALVTRDFPGAWIAPIRDPRERPMPGKVDPSE